MPYTKLVDGQETEEKHESFVQVGFSRINGRSRLFGSSLLHNDHSICLVVRETSKITDNTGTVRYHGKLSPLLKVDLSPAQFSELLTSMNVGNGVPATLRSFNGHNIEDVPEEMFSESESIRESFDTQLGDLSSFLTSALSEAREIAGKKSATKSSVNSLLKIVEKVHREVVANTPYMLELFQEAAERVVVAAKAEVDSFTLHALVSAGMKKISKDNTKRLEE